MTEGDTRLEADKFDAAEIIDRLVSVSRSYVGEAGHRVVGPELEKFIRVEVTLALVEAMRHVEGKHVRRMVEHADVSSRTILEAVFAGVEIGKRGESRVGPGG